MVHTHTGPEDVNHKIKFTLKKIHSNPDWPLTKDTLMN
jgi:hypothetical protein